MQTREEAVAACIALGNVYEDYPFHDFNWTVMRHRENQKTFALIFEREGRIWINAKATPEGCFLLRELFSAVVPAYHMNKTHWVSVILDGSMEDVDILQILRDSYRLTAPKPKKAKS